MRQGASPPPHSHPQIWRHETAANKPGTSCGVFSASSPPTSLTAFTRYTGAHTWERACRPPLATVGGCAFVRSCTCTVGFVTRHGSHPKDDDGGDEFGVCGVQPVPCPIVCTALLCATMLPPPSTCHRCPLHAAPTLYMPPPPSPSSRRRWAGTRSHGAVPAQSASLRIMAAVPGSGGSRMTTAGMNSGCAACNLYPALSCALCRCIPLRRRHPLHATTTLYMLPLHSTCCHHALHAAAAALSVPPPLPLCAITGLTTGHCLYLWHHPCPWPSCMHHAQPGPLGVHIAITRVLPASTPLTRAHTPPLCAPRVLAPSLAPSVAVPRVSAPITCALAS